MLMRVRLRVHERVRTNIKCIRAVLERREGRCDILRSPDFGRSDLKAEHAGCRLDLAHFQHGGGIADIGHDRQPAKIGYYLTQDFESLADSIRHLVRQTGDVAARSRQTCDQASPDRVRHRREHDRNDRCSLLCREGWRGSHGDNDIDLDPDELCRDLGETRRGVPPPSDTQSRGCDHRSKRVHGAVVQKRQSVRSRPKAWRPRTRWSVACPPAARAPRAAMRPPRRPGA